MGRRILMVAGEASGDAQAAELAAALVRQDDSAELYGIGGARMRAAGVRTFIDCRELSLMGIVEISSGLARVWRAYRELTRTIRREPPDLVILIDFPDFNLRLARVARRAGIPVFYYVSPQVWAWRRGRIRKICARVDRMVVLFPFERELYQQHGLDAHFVGHPLAEHVQPTRHVGATRDRYGLSKDRSLVSLLPGSRAKEVRQMLPVMLAAAKRLADKSGFVIASAPGLDRHLIESCVREAGTDVAIAESDTYNLVAASDVAAVTSGTATVECALLGVPMVVLYRMSPLSYPIARLLVRVPYIAMPNILLEAAVVPELIQRQATPEGLAREISRYLESRSLRSKTTARLAEIRRKLVMPGAADRAAALALELIA